MIGETYTPEPPMTLELQNGVAIVTVPRGRPIDMYSTPEMRNLFIDAVSNKETTSLVVDLSQTDFIDQTGLGALVGLMKRTRERHIPLVIDYSEQPAIQKVFRITRLVDHFQVVGSRTECELAAEYLQ